MSLEKYLQELADESKPLKHSGLLRFSSLMPEEVEELSRAWPTLGVERRRQILTRLVDMAEDNVELDFDLVYRHALHDPDSQVRAKTVAGLWESNDRTLITPLIELLFQDEAEEVCAAASIALGKFALLAKDGKILPRDGDRIQETLLTIIEGTGESPEVRRRAIEAIAPFNTPRVHELIKEAYYGENPRFRYSAVHAMGRSCDPCWLPIILSELASADPAMRYEAANAC